MTTGTETITLVNGKTYTLVLDHDERITEALGEVPENPSLTDVVAFGMAAYRAISTNKEIPSRLRNEAMIALRSVIDEASILHDGAPLFPR
jgi:hypothetical protein